MDKLHFINKFKNYKGVRATYNFFTDTSTFRKTLKLSLLYVFLFYLPFLFVSLVLNEVMFFQLDYVYQFSTIVFDFRNRLMNLNFSTWDFKNGLGYDYFANFYYIPLDITLLPYFLFPFLSYSQLMWLTFVFKVLIGTACFTYLLKLYKLNHKTILFMSILYGTADLFFAQNVFASYSGLIIYIPLILIAIELMFQKNNFLIFSLVIFQTFLFNYYWAWNLSLFMALALLGRTIYAFFTKKNVATLEPYKKSLLFIGKSIAFYLLGLGLAGFFFFPTFLGIMQNEPRMGNSFFDVFSHLKSAYGPMVYQKQFFKSIIPNLNMYSGYFWDSKIGQYWLTTNHIIIYSSILATFSLIYIVFYPKFLAKRKLDDKQLKIFLTLKVVNIIALVMVLMPFTSYLFSLNSGPYLRWLVFFGFLMIINLAYIYEYKLFNKEFFIAFLVICVGFLIYSIKFNTEFVAQYRLAEGKYPNSFITADENTAYTMIVAYIAIIVLVFLLDKYIKLSYILLFERIVGIFLIFALCISPRFTAGVSHADIYGKEVNNMMKNIELDDYYIVTDFLFYNDETYTDTMQDMTYLFNFPVYNNFNLFHSLVNPNFTYYMSGHTRYLRTIQVPYLFYYYMDPSLTIISNAQNKKVKNGMYDPEMELVAKKNFDDLGTYLSIYKKEPKFSIGNGFTTYYSFDFKKEDNLFGFDFLWLDSIYVSDIDIVNYLKVNGFNPTNSKDFSFLNKPEYELEFTLKKIPNYSGNFYPFHFNYLSRDEAEAVFFGGTSNEILAFAEDKYGKIERCYNKFCFVPESGLKTIYIQKMNPTFYIIDKDYLDEKVSQIQKYSAYDVKINNGHITSKVANDQPIIMTYKVGYAPGWNVYVDNEKVETFASFNGQLSFLIHDTGVHNIEMRYETPYLRLGIYITLVSIIVFSGLTYYTIKKRGKKCLSSSKK